ncbi:allophanate hydrolase subunit 1 [Defluviimonas sp. WL0002]|uniref:Allophanate hydrolase subunit 1 n=1 Tax=Albidovulum marisflavi TaxID=2984159 RepID=A0ABT2Z7E7_9RHOB|nr:allophanate hydrolase subunit 1 [Defluviimonas sp. WL0002]MCV2867020.1 allophanate hydrolase subunit 1 [Defluviimonas sp. WL0002]
MTAAQGGFPAIRTLGLTGLLVSFADQLSEPANRAALAFRAAVEREGLPGVEETSTSLASVFLRFDPLAVAPGDLRERIAALLGTRDWYSAPLPANRRRWRIPTVYGTDLAPQLEEAAEAAGMTADAAVAELSRTTVRVLTIGFAPGQPYLGELPPAWDLPRQVALTRRVPEGALVVAIRQFVLFSAPTPTGWRHIGQTAFRAFRPQSETPFPLRPGDELIFPAIGRDEFDQIRAADTSGDGGATVETIA